MQDFTEDQLRGWLEGFGKIEDVYLLKDVDKKLTAKGYVRFASHRHAESCIQAQASEQDAEEGDVIAWWSHSERAMRGGPSLHSALASNDGRVFAHLLEQCQVREVWMQPLGLDQASKIIKYLPNKLLFYLVLYRLQRIFCCEKCLGWLRGVASGRRKIQQPLLWWGNRSTLWPPAQQSSWRPPVRVLGCFGLHPGGARCLVSGSAGLP